ncbi:MAG: flagellar hook capping protein [Firmicutes bacterium]|nr:flagellar hook capping protein [Bacillota bacterium]
MSAITSVSNDYIIQPSKVQTDDDPNSLGSEDFMELLITQIQNQDPMNPMDNTEFISQMAEFSALEEMQSMNSSMNSMYAFGLMGKEVTINNGDGTVTTGVVDTVSVKNGVNYVEVGGVQYNSQLVMSASQVKEDNNETDNSENVEEEVVS